MATIILYPVLICAGLGVILVQHAFNFSNFEIYDFFQSFLKCELTHKVVSGLYGLLWAFLLMDVLECKCNTYVYQQLFCTPLDNVIIPRLQLFIRCIYIRF